MDDKHPSTSQWDVFISHASEDKADIALPLAEGLRKFGLRVRLDRLREQRIDVLAADPVSFQIQMTAGAIV